MRQDGIALSDGPTIERLQHDPMERIDQLVGGELRRVHRTVSTIRIMIDSGRFHRDGVDREQWEQQLETTARKFRDDFDRAHLSELHAPDVSRIPGCGHRGDLSENTYAARERVAHALRALGGHASPVGQAAWWVLGYGASINEFAQRMRWGKAANLNPKIATGLVVGALWILTEREY
jgi:hypothetical protein